MTSPKRFRLPTARFLVFAAVLFVSAVLAAAVVFTVVSEPAPPVDPSLETGARLSATFVPQTELDRLISAYEERITTAESPSDFLLLGQLYLEKGRVTGDLARYAQAEAAFARGQELRPEDPIAEVGLAQTELAMHRFDEALARVDGLARLDAVAVATDALLAKGELDAAERSLDILAVDAETAGPILVRRSQLAWLRGDHETALDLALDAVDRDDANTARRSWYQAFAAQMAFQVGDLPVATDLAEAAVADDSENVGALAVLARTAWAHGDLERAAELLTDATNPVPDPALLDALGDVLTARGSADAAAQAYATIDVLATLGEAGGAYDRAVASSLADRGVQPERAVEIARRDLEVRQDAYTHDALAWALFRAGRVGEAVDSIEAALRTGISDAAIDYHAAEIFSAAGELERARDRISSSLAINPHFDVILAKDARLLAEMLNA